MWLFFKWKVLTVITASPSFLPIASPLSCFLLIPLLQSNYRTITYSQIVSEEDLYGRILIETLKLGPGIIFTLSSSVKPFTDWTRELRAEEDEEALEPELKKLSFPSEEAIETFPLSMSMSSLVRKWEDWLYTRPRVTATCQKRSFGD